MAQKDGHNRIVHTRVLMNELMMLGENINVERKSPVKTELWVSCLVVIRYELMGNYLKCLHFNRL